MVVEAEIEEPPTITIVIVDVLASIDHGHLATTYVIQTPTTPTKSSQHDRTPVETTLAQINHNGTFEAE